MNFQRKLCTTSMLIAAWYALPAAADLQIHSASILSNTLYIDGQEFTPPSSTIEPLIQINGTTLQVLQTSDGHLEARVPTGFQLAPGVSYQLYVSSLGDPDRFGSLTTGKDLSKHSSSLALVAPSGATGATGAKGATGATGAAGARGATGAAGTAGAKGTTGATGAAGAKGATGAAGTRGGTGATGAIGAKGGTGATGAQGLQGIQGVQGLKGATGAIGLTGATGPTGATGATGAEGSLVSRFQGEWLGGTNYDNGSVVTYVGSSWLCTVATPLCFSTPGADTSWTPLAAAGATGAAGAQGLPGEIGPAGAVGPQGSAGPKGDQGAKGDPGAEGPAGPQGVQGLNGDPGPVGPQGPVGAQGLQGVPGPAGVAGATGPSGTSTASLGQINWSSPNPTGAFLFSTNANWQSAFGSAVTFASNSVVAFSVTGQFQVFSPTNSASTCYVSVLVDGVPVGGACDAANKICPYAQGTSNSTSLTSHALTQYATVTAGSHVLSLGISNAGSGGLCGLYQSRVSYMILPR